MRDLDQILRGDSKYDEITGTIELEDENRGLVARAKSRALKINSVIVEKGPRYGGHISVL